MAGALVSFAYTGNPNHKGLPKWNVAEKDVIPTMIFDKETEEKINYDDKLIELVEKAGALGPGDKGPERLYGGGTRLHI